MKQLIILITALLLLISCENDIVGSNDNESQNSTYDLLQGFWKGDSIYEQFGDSIHQNVYNYNFTFNEDTLTKKYISKYSYLFSISNNTIIVTDFNGSNLFNYYITELNQDTLRIKASWNNTSFKLVR